MTAEEALREGRAGEALEAMKDRVRKDPSDAKLRVSLFELLCIAGDWDRALTQLNLAGEMDAQNLAMANAYREALSCEALRSVIFAGKRSPMVFGEPEDWIAMVIESLRLLGEGKPAAAGELRDQAFEAAPATSGTIGGESFEWIADADTRLGPILEALIEGRYHWVPFHRIREVHFEEPADLRDLVWFPARFVWANGGEAVGMVPTRYPGSESDEDDRIRLARRTAWTEQEGGTYTGSGQRMLSTDTGEFPLLDVREIALNVETG